MIGPEYKSNCDRYNMVQFVDELFPVPKTFIDRIDNEVTKLIIMFGSGSIN